jgi:hypothetical protein
MSDKEKEYDFLQDVDDCDYTTSSERGYSKIPVNTDIIPPPPPTGLDGTINASGIVTLTWNKSYDCN